MIDESAMLAVTNDLMIILLFVAAAIFGWQAFRSRDTRGFQFQISVFIIVWVIGEIVEELINKATDNSTPATISDLVLISPNDIGSIIHIISMAFFCVMLWLRWYLSRKSLRTLI